MTSWVRYRHADRSGIGILDGDRIEVCDNALFEAANRTGDSLALADVELLAPLEPHSILALWNNFHQRATAEGNSIPETPLYFMKPVTSVIGPGATIYRPPGYAGRVIYEAELGIVIGRECHRIEPEQADDHIFGYTCVNDVTAINCLGEDDSFQQWTRSKGFDSFTPVGPVIETDIDTDELQVKALLNGRQRQDYPVSDMIFSPRQIVAMLSSYQTLRPGDLICCGTSVGTLPMKSGAEIEISIEGIGSLINRFEDSAET